MPDDSPSPTIWKPVMAFLVLALIATVALYQHYGEGLKLALAQSSHALSQTKEQLQDAQAKLNRSVQQGEGLNTEVATLNEQLSAAKQSEAELTQQIDALQQAHAADRAAREADHAKTVAEIKGTHAQAIAKIKDTHARAIAEIKDTHAKAMTEAQKAHEKSLAAELEKLAQATAAQKQAEDAYKEVVADYDSAKNTIVRLEANLAQVNDAIAESAAEHRAQVERLERHINERIQLARVTPKDADLIRAARLAGVLSDEETPPSTDASALGAPAAPADEASTEGTPVEGEAEKGQTGPAAEQLAGPAAAPEQSQGEQSTAGDKQAGKLAALQAEHETALKEHAGEVAALKAEHKANLDDLRAELQDVQAQLEQARSDLAKSSEDAAAAMEKLKLAHASELDEAKQHVASLTEQLASQTGAGKELAALQAQLQRDQSEMARLRDQASSAKTALAASQSAHAKALKAADARLTKLTGELDEARAALTELQGRYDTDLASLNQALDGAQGKLATVEAALSAAKSASASPQQIDTAEARIAELEASIEQERHKAELMQTAIRQEAEASVADLRGLYKQFSSLGGHFTDRGMLLRLADTELRFPSGGATLPATDLPSLDRIAKLLKERPELTTRIEGHTDSAGSDALNLELSKQRAEAVKQALMERGIAAARISAEGVGSARPIASNATAAGRRENRRVEIYVIE